MSTADLTATETATRALGRTRRIRRVSHQDMIVQEMAGVARAWDSPFLLAAANDGIAGVLIEEGGFSGWYPSTPDADLDARYQAAKTAAQDAILAAHARVRGEFADVPAWDAPARQARYAALYA